MKKHLHWSFLGISLVLLAMLSFTFRKVLWPAFAAILATAHPAAIAQGPTVVHVSDQVLHENVLRLGMNLGGQGYYGSSQILANLISRNPGFEAPEWQSVLKCARATTTTCTDANPYANWPAGFLDGATFEVVGGPANRQTGRITHSTAIDKAANAGITLQFDPLSAAPVPNDSIIVRKRFPTGDAPPGWKVYVERGGTVSSEANDLSPSTPGKQALHMTANGKDQLAAVTAFFDTTGGHSYLRLHGPYVIRFRAKGVGGNRVLSVDLRRVTADGSGSPLFAKKITLGSSWQDYSFPLDVDEGPTPIANMGLGFAVFEGEALVDDASLTHAGSNGTAFRDEVVSALDRLHPGVLRYMDSGQNYGSSLENMLTGEFGRRPTGFSPNGTEPQDIPIGLHDFLVLCEKLKTEPWYTLQIGATEQESRDLVEYLGGAPSTRFGALRAKLGHPRPWTQTFPHIHLEYGNEAWNTAQAGAVLADAAVYRDRTAALFKAMRSSPAYSPQSFDLIANGWVIATDWNAKVIGSGQDFDTIDIAPYTFGTFADDASTERIFGPMFAQPEMMDSTRGGTVHQQAEVSSHAARPVHLAVYESNIDTRYGTVPQASLDAAVPSLAAGLTNVEHMLLMLRDLGITVQNTFQLTGSGFSFTNTSTHADETSPIWGVVVDLGPTNRVRPSYLAQQMANQAIRPTMLTTTLTGANPTWDQPLSPNDKVQLKGAHDLQTFAFTDGKTDTLILFNLDRTAAHALTLAGSHAPSGTVQVQTLTSANITDSNEGSERVKIASREERDVQATKTVFTLPPFSMTTLSASHAVRP